ncbi:hypothetical protein LYNGBM3L_57990 [Moorena producens 3L]|uniref:Uncharacterized protein n=1 Tax=Moorena producens 3L TaxID=489825 RepID=F4XZN7_9CYAN|nr:hypothetical protein LYNGBM3L_57990 [Moorena producens 3L]OLT68491.1 hypothetical protein BI334_28885 [Moorena producens 3L]
MITIKKPSQQLMLVQLNKNKQINYINSEITSQSKSWKQLRWLDNNLTQTNLVWRLWVILMIVVTHHLSNPRQFQS